MKKRIEMFDDHGDILGLQWVGTLGPGSMLFIDIHADVTGDGKMTMREVGLNRNQVQVLRDRLDQWLTRTSFEYAAEMWSASEHDGELRREEEK